MLVIGVYLQFTHPADGAELGDECKIYSSDNKLRCFKLEIETEKIPDTSRVTESKTFSMPAEESSEQVSSAAESSSLSAQSVSASRTEKGESSSKKADTVSSKSERTNASSENPSTGVAGGVSLGTVILLAAVGIIRKKDSDNEK